MANNETIFQPLLPKLKEGQDRKIENFPRRGLWHARASLELDRLSNSLKTEKLEFEVNSIPDMWARPIIFEMALFDANHPIHDRILGEWRGLLALLALRRLRRFTDLGVKSLKIPVGEDRENAPDFLKTLSKVIPQKKYAPDSSWENLSVILFNDNPIGMTSPITLVCTATHYVNLIDGVSWYDGKFLLNPVPDLNATEKKSLAGWLKQLKSSLLKHKGLNTDMMELNTLLTLLDRYIDDLGGSRVEVKLSTDTLGMKSGIFQYLDKPVHLTEEMAEQSHVGVVASRRPAPQDTLLVVDKDIARQWDIREQDILVYRAIPLDRISPADLVGDRNTLLDTHLIDARWCKPEDFFTEKLILVKQKNAFPGTISVDGSIDLFFQDVPVTPVIPVTGILLPYLDTEDIANRLRFEQLEEEFKVTLNIPLAGQGGNSRDFEISRSYRAKEGEVETVTAVPILEIWPNFISPDWKAYYTYFSTTGEKTFYATPWNSDENKRSFPLNKEQIDREISRLGFFPEVFDCKNYRIDPKNKKPVPYDVGVLLVTKPEPLSSQGKSFKVGVDFGSSSTNVFIQEEDNNPERIVFEDRFFKITDAPTAKRAELYDHFLPGTKEEMPFLSIFHDFLIAKEEVKPLLDGHIYFPYHRKEFDASKDEMKLDLKWGDKDERRRARAFLEQLCLQCTAEAAFNGGQKISWRFSFPTAFSAVDRDAFIQLWNQIAGDNLDLTGIKLIEEKPKYKSESIAAARYFANNKDIKAALPRGAVFIDIGGRTSDVSIWGRDNELMMQTSLQFAGRDIFASPLLEKTDFLKGIIDDEDLKMLKQKKVKKNPLAFYAQLDSIVSVESDKILRKLPQYGSETDMRKFKQLIGIGVAGLFYYVGILIKSFKNTKDYIETVPNIYVGGNGSRLLHWLASGEFNDDSAYNRLLQSVFRESFGASKNQDFEIKVSPEPKAEVACGLTMDATTLIVAQDELSLSHFLSGEAFIVQEKEYEWETYLTPELITSGIKISPKMEQFKRFIETFDQTAKPLGILPIEAGANFLEKTKDQVNNQLANMKYKKAGELRIEPLFILALKEFLELKVK